MRDEINRLCEQVRKACADNKPLRIVGGDSKHFMGRRATGGILFLSGHSGVLDYEPTELVITARSGTKLSELESVLAEHDQTLGCEPPMFDTQATIGGTLACNQSGPARPWLGSIRDHVLGIRLINGRSEHLRFGGTVIKNVAGYDVTRLQAGAMGTLGVITEVSLRVFPRPETVATVVRDCSCQEAIASMKHWSSRGGALSGACWVDDRLFFRFSGCGPAVRSHVKNFNADLFEGSGQFWAALKEQQHAFFDGDMPLWRFSLESGANHFRPGGQWLIDWGGAQRWLRGDYEFGEMESLAQNAHGQVSLFRGGNRDGEVFHSKNEMQKLIHKRIKTAFDPQGIFNPGRLYGWM